MPKKQSESLSQRFDRFEKIDFPMQSSIISCATNSLDAAKAYLASGKDQKAEATLRACLDKWKSAIQEYKGKSER